MRVQSASTSQAALPPIAPRPSPPIQQNVTGLPPAVVTQGPSAEQYGLFGYTFDGQTYGQTFSETNVPSNTLLYSEQQRGSFDDNHVVVETESLPKSHLGSTQEPKLRHRTTGESDSGIDMTFAAYSSHSSSSSSGPPTMPFVPQTQEVSPPSIALPQRSLDPLPQALFPPHIDQIFPEQWRNVEHKNYTRWQWPSHPPSSENRPFVTVQAQLHPSEITPTTYHGIPTPIQGSTGKTSFLSPPVGAKKGLIITNRP